MNRALAIAVFLLLLTSQPARPDTSSDEAHFRELYKELLETNTTLSAGSGTLAAERMAARLRAAGFPDSDLHLFTAPDFGNPHGLNEYVPVRSLMEGRDFLYRLVKIYAEQK
jgi:acetylornithine deacetylase/succinyl-diaminopimelate desuccinylase-like protein